MRDLSIRPVKPNAAAAARLVCLACGLLLLQGCGKDSDPDGQASAQSSSATDPAALAVLPSSLKIDREEKTYVITGIGLRGSNTVAIINGSVVIPGEEIDPGVVLEEIQPTYAIIRAGQTKYLIRPEDIQRELDKKRN